MNINKVAVIGAGVMGASIAAHLSNAGVPVYLLDIVPKPELSTNRNHIAETAVEKLLKAQPAPFMHKNNARLITTG
ncbi:MAG: 3-hydroxyacyl-CoA dehydrogenase NAD-binding domain-containing protein, partial [Methylococcales bacterium]|nr:3-hydroxyacyl-CoA dehydrogenase NAD-binding domain-containing protein [Methylococcales bacterium]